MTALQCEVLVDSPLPPIVEYGSGATRQAELDTPRGHIGYLAAEIIRLIGSSLSVRDLRNLRLAGNASLSAALRSAIHATLYLDFDVNKIASTLDKLRILASPNSDSDARYLNPAWVKKAVIRSLGLDGILVEEEVPWLPPTAKRRMPWEDRFSSEMRSAEKDALGLMKPALEKLHCVVSVSWEYHKADASNVREEVMDAFLGYENLRSFRLVMKVDCKVLPVDRLRGLHELALEFSTGRCAAALFPLIPGAIAKSPQLRSLQIGIDELITAQTISPDNVNRVFSELDRGAILPLSHLSLTNCCIRFDKQAMKQISHLTSLCIVGCRMDHRKFWHHWLHLAEEDDSQARALEELEVDHLTSTLLFYLSKRHSVLRVLKLKLTHSAFSTSVDPVSAAKAFWKTALPPHASSLEVLWVTYPCMGKWAFDGDSVTRVAPLLRTCEKLRELAICVEQKPDPLTGKLETWRAAHGGEPETIPIKPVLDGLLCSLPALEKLQIAETIPLQGIYSLQGREYSTFRMEMRHGIRTLLGQYVYPAGIETSRLERVSIVDGAVFAPKAFVDSAGVKGTRLRLV